MMTIFPRCAPVPAKPLSRGLGGRILVHVFEDAAADDHSPLSAVLAGEPGPGLAAALGGVDPRGLDGAELVDYITACERLAGWIAAGQLDAIAELTRRRPPAPQRAVGLADRGQGEARFSEFTADEVAAACTLSRVAAGNRVELAVALGTRLPGTWAALRGGGIDVVRARAVAEATGVLDDAGAAAVEARVLVRARHQTVGELTAALRRAVLRVDPGAAERRRVRAVRERAVRHYPGEDGMSELWASLPGQDATAVYAAVNAVAHRGSGPGDDRSMDARRADALVDLVLGRITAPGARGWGAAPGSGVAGLVNVTVAAGTLLGVDDEPGELAGYGPITAEVARRIAESGTWQRILTDPASGAVLDVGRRRYRPTTAITKIVQARDRRCRFPRCRQPARRCDLDHTLRYPDGPTSVGNLALLCRHHHRLKHHTTWTVQQTPDATMIWTSPTGHTYLTYPEGLGPPEAPPGVAATLRLQRLKLTGSPRAA
jgi:hypothetical protein